MNKNMRCFFTHKWNKWKFINTFKTKTGITVSVLRRKCKRCNKTDEHIGMCDVNIITGDKTPYEYKN